MSFAKALALAVLLVPGTAAAQQQCWVTWNCGRISSSSARSQCASLYGGRLSGRNGPFPSCSGWRQMDKISSCTCGAAGSAPSGGGSMEDAMGQMIGAALQGNQQAAAMAMGMAGAQMLGAGIGQALRGDPQAAARRAAEAEAARIRAEQERQRRQAAFDANKNALLQQMDGGAAAAPAMGFKDDDDGLRPKPFAAYANEGPDEFSGEENKCKGLVARCRETLSAQGQAMDDANWHRADGLVGHLRAEAEGVVGEHTAKAEKKFWAYHDDALTYERPHWDQTVAGQQAYRDYPWANGRYDGNAGSKQAAFFEDKFYASRGKYDVNEMGSIYRAFTATPERSVEMQKLEQKTFDRAKPPEPSGVPKTASHWGKKALEGSDYVEGKWNTSKEYNEWMGHMLDCQKLPDMQANSCINALTKTDGPMDVLSMAGAKGVDKVKRAGKAVSKFAQDTLNTATDLIDRASRCLGSECD